MRLVFQSIAWDELMWWRANDHTNTVKVLDLIQDCIRDPWTGLGKPEALKYQKPFLESSHR